MTDNNNSELSIKAERLELLFKQSHLAAYLSPLVAALLAAALLEVQTIPVLATWLGIIAISTLARLIVFNSYFAANRPISNLQKWEQLYIVTTLLYFAGWSIGGVFILPADNLLYQILLMYFLIGMAGSAISVFSAQRLVQISSVIILLVPGITLFFLQNSLLTTCIALGGTFFLLSAMRSSKVLTESITMNARLNRQLEAAKIEAEILANIDELTKLHNRRAFYRDGSKLLQQCLTNNNPCSVMILDIDNFKEFNDQYGHSIGDSVLQNFAAILSHNIRTTDFCARIGGEEFAIILAATSLTTATEIGYELVAAISQYQHDIGQDHLPTITASIGIACNKEETFAQFIQRADGALYKAKNMGRNQVIAA
jgi:diguanylate cyclase (GGDEF)-like protein